MIASARALPRIPLGAPCGGLPAPRTPRPAFEKSGGKLAGKLFWVSGGRCWPAAHRERRASFVYGKPGRKRGGGWGVWTVENRNGSGGAAGAHSAHNAGAGANGPRPCVGFAGPEGPQNAAAPRRRPPATPPPPRQRTSAGPPAVAHGKQEGRRGHGGGRRRLAAGGRPQGRPPACQTKSAGWRQSLRPRAFQDASRPAAAPPGAGFSTYAKKATQKPGLSSNLATPRPPPGKRW